MARVVVTGHAGFIGYHLSSRLIRAGHDLLGIDAVTDYYDPRLKQDRLAQLDSIGSMQHLFLPLENREVVKSRITDFGPDVIVHLAAQAGVRYSIEHPDTYISSNVDGTLTILEAARDANPAHLLIASTSSVYGGNETMPFSESHTTHMPVSLYAATKIAVEAMAHSYSHLWKIPTTCFRFFTVYGAWGRPDMALFKFVDAIETGLPIDVYGYGKMMRDFTYVDDLVNAVESLLIVPPVENSPVSDYDSLSRVAPFRTVNIAAGAPTGLLEFVDAIEAAVGKEAEKRLLPMQPGDVVATFADSRLLADLIGDLPRTSVSDGVREFVDWYRHYRNPETRKSHNRLALAP